MRVRTGPSDVRNVELVCAHGRVLKHLYLGLDYLCKRILLVPIPGSRYLQSSQVARLFVCHSQLRNVLIRYVRVLRCMLVHATTFGPVQFPLLSYLSLYFRYVAALILQRMRHTQPVLLKGHRFCSNRGRSRGLIRCGN